MVTEMEPNQEETIPVCVVHRALTLTLHVPGAIQVFVCVAEPQGERSEPSPFQSNWYAMVCPRLEVEPPAV